MQRTMSKPIVPQKTSNGNIFVDWYTTDDPANPQNWSNGQAVPFSLIICPYTFIVYMALRSTPPASLASWNKLPTSALAAVRLSLSRCTSLAYGRVRCFGLHYPKSPLSAGLRFTPQPWQSFHYSRMPTALVDNFAGLSGPAIPPGLLRIAVSRQSGLPQWVICVLCSTSHSHCKSPGQIYHISLTYYSVAWVSAAYCGPALGPLLSGFAVTAEGWRWSLWEDPLGRRHPIFLVMFMLLPKPAHPTSFSAGLSVFAS